MIKSIGLLRRKPGLTHEEFLNYWETKHAPLILRTVPGQRRYIQNQVVWSSDPGYEVDGIAETWYESLEEYQRRWKEWRQSEIGKIVQADENKFIDMSRHVRFIVEEHLIR